MSRSSRLLLAAAVLLAATPAIGSAQGTIKSGPPKDSADAMLDHTFTVPNEGVRVFLAGGVTYRAEFQGQGISLQLRPIGATVQEPVIAKVLAGTGAGNTAMFSIKPRADAWYQMTAVGGTTNSPVNLKLTVQKKKA